MEGDRQYFYSLREGDSGVLVLTPLCYDVQLRSLLATLKITPFNQLNLELKKDNKQMPFNRSFLTTVLASWGSINLINRKDKLAEGKRGWCV